MIQLATRVDDASGETFKSITKQLGTTPADAMRMFAMAFTANQGFPYDVRLLASPGPFRTEGEVLAYVDDLAAEIINDAR